MRLLIGGNKKCWRKLSPTFTKYYQPKFCICANTVVNKQLCLALFNQIISHFPNILTLFIQKLKSLYFATTAD